MSESTQYSVLLWEFSEFDCELACSIEAGEDPLRLCLRLPRIAAVETVAGLISSPAEWATQSD